MDIVDSQAHLGPGGIDEMVAALDALGIASIMIDEYWMGTPGHPFYLVGEGGKAQRKSSPTAELAAWTHPGRFSYLISPDPRDPELKSVIRQARDAEHVRALRISPGMERATIRDLNDGVFDEIFALSIENGLPLFVQISGHTDMLERVVKKYPDVRIIVCHCGMPPGGDLWPIFAQMEGEPDSVDYWRKVGEEPKDEAFAKVLRCADWPQVALKWAHTGVMFDAGGYPNLAARPFLRKAIDAFGADRIMWASDISANQTGESWAELMFAIRENPELSTEEKEWILGKTARTWLNWQKQDETT